jgi:hypothetical protein
MGMHAGGVAVTSRRVPPSAALFTCRYASSLGCIVDSWAGTALQYLTATTGLNPNNFVFK